MARRKEKIERGADAAESWGLADDRPLAPRNAPPSPPPESCVAAGAAWLDRRKPRWARAQDPDRVDVQSVLFCPLTLAFGGPPHGWAEGIKAVAGADLSIVKARRDGERDGFKGADIRQLAALGFAAPSGAGDVYAELNAAWSREIRARRSSS